MSIKTWKARLLIKRIERYNNHVDRMQKHIEDCKIWIERDTDTLNSLLQKISKEETFKLFQGAGYVDDEDYSVINKRMKRVRR